MLEQRPYLQQKQSLVLSQKQIQGFKILSMSALDLRSAILTEVEKNPALEIVSDSIEKKRQKPKSEKYGTLSSYVRERKKMHSAKSEQASDEYRKFLESIPDNRETLQSHLLEQLAFKGLSERLFNFAEMVVQNLDKRGFNIVAVSELLSKYNEENLNEKITDDEADEIIDLIQRLDPIGCAVGSAEDLDAKCFASLSKQAEILFEKQVKYDKCYYYAIDLLKHHRECFKKPSPSGFWSCIKKISSEYATLTLDDAKYILELISTLNPFPGLQFRNADLENQYIFPEVIVKKSETGFSAIVNDDEIPVLRVSKFFERAAIVSKEKSGSNNLKKCVQDAADFINSLNFRKETLLKLASAIIIYQYDFFRKGPKYLSPLSQQDIAEELKLNNSTISRCANGKYLQCDWGVFEIKYFFSNSIVSKKPLAKKAQSAGNHSKNAVKEFIKDIIQESGKKLSDQKISDELLERGIKISRRTVTKYRNELGIDVSYMRD
ncbi:MAG: RNA polymerase sigma-54 factor [Treponema sp.]|nr:MAG: RNA polymerase sigma-54 factor [Treponema sp.]